MTMTARTAERIVRAPRRGVGAAGAAALATCMTGSAAAAQDCAARWEGFAAPSAEVELAASEPGLLAEVLLREGDPVKAGQLVARLDSRLAEADLAASQARAAAEGRLELARTRADFAARRLAEVDKLRRSGAVRPMEILEAESAAASAAAELAAARDDRKLAELDVVRAEARLASLEIRAPVDGVIDELHRDAAEFVGAGETRVATLIALDPLHLDVFVPAACLAGLARGGAVEATGPDAVAREAAIRDVGRQVDAPTGLLRLGLDIPNPDGALRAGDRLTVSLTLPESAHDAGPETAGAAAGSGG